MNILFFFPFLADILTQSNRLTTYVSLETDIFHGEGTKHSRYISSPSIHQIQNAPLLLPKDFLPLLFATVT